MAYLWPWRPAPFRRVIAESAISSVTGSNQRARSAPFSTFPLAFRGSSATNSTSLGTL